jgi:hypothetical protein
VGGNARFKNGNRLDPTTCRLLQQNLSGAAIPAKRIVSGDNMLSGRNPSFATQERQLRMENRRHTAPKDNIAEAIP